MPAQTRLGRREDRGAVGERRQVQLHLGIFPRAQRQRIGSHDDLAMADALLQADEPQVVAGDEMLRPIAGGVFESGQGLTAKPVARPIRMAVGAREIELPGLAGEGLLASLGGFVKQYQVTVDPNKLLSYNLPITAVIEAIKDMEMEVNDLSRFIREEANVLSYLETLKLKTGGLSEKAVMREKLLVMEKKLRKELERLEGKQAAVEAGLKEFMSSKEWKEIASIGRDVDDYTERCEMMRGDFNQTAEMCDKAFKKAFHGKKVSLPADLFEEAVLQGKDFSGLLAKALDAGKPAEIKKLKVLQKALAGAGELRQEYRQMEQTMKEAQRVLKMHKGFFERKKEAEGERTSLGTQIEGMKAELTHLDTQKAAVERTATEERILVEQLMAEVSEKKVRIV